MFFLYMIYSVNLALDLTDQKYMLFSLKNLKTGNDLIVIYIKGCFLIFYKL